MIYKGSLLGETNGGSRIGAEQVRKPSKGQFQANFWGRWVQFGTYKHALECGYDLKFVPVEEMGAGLLYFSTHQPLSKVALEVGTQTPKHFQLVSGAPARSASESIRCLRLNMSKPFDTPPPTPIPQLHLFSYLHRAPWSHP